MLLTPGLCALVPEEMLFAHRASSFQFVCVCACLLRFCFSDDFYFHLTLIERKIMHTFISFWFQSHTFREKRKKNRLLCFFIGCFMLWKTHFMYTSVCVCMCVCTSEIFIDHCRWRRRLHFSPTFFLRKIKEMSIFGGWLVEICIEFPFTPIFQSTSKKKKKKKKKENVPMGCDSRNKIDFAYSFEYINVSNRIFEPHHCCLFLLVGLKSILIGQWSPRRLAKLPLKMWKKLWMISTSVIRYLMIFDHINGSSVCVERNLPVPFRRKSIHSCSNLVNQAPFERETETSIRKCLCVCASKNNKKKPLQSLCPLHRDRCKCDD